MKISNLLLTILICVLCLTSCGDNDDPECTAVVHDLANAIQNVGTATLKREAHTISMTMDVDNLLPGHAYSAWWVIWNKSEKCATPNICSPNPDLANNETEVELLYADGMVVEADGKGRFAGSLLENDISGSIYEIIGKPTFGGLQNALDSEVHLVLRSHGPEISGKTSEQIGSFLGGCSMNFPGFSATPSAAGECGNIMAAVFHRTCSN